MEEIPLIIISLSGVKGRAKVMDEETQNCKTRPVPKSVVVYFFNTCLAPHHRIIAEGINNKA